jgi:hypothetical protein
MISDLQETFACCCCRLFLTSAGDESGHMASTESWTVPSVVLMNDTE